METEYMATVLKLLDLMLHIQDNMKLSEVLKVMSVIVSDFQKKQPETVTFQLAALTHSLPTPLPTFPVNYTLMVCTHKPGHLVHLLLH